jgi:hypothetical protein
MYIKTTEMISSTTQLWDVQGRRYSTPVLGFMQMHSQVQMSQNKFGTTPHSFPRGGFKDV